MPSRVIASLLVLLTAAAAWIRWRTRASLPGPEIPDRGNLRRLTPGGEHLSRPDHRRRGVARLVQSPHLPHHHLGGVAFVNR